MPEPMVVYMQQTRETKNYNVYEPFEEAGFQPIQNLYIHKSRPAMNVIRIEIHEEEAEEK